VAAVNRRCLGRTGLAVTELSFGGAPIGNLYASLDDETAAATVDTAWRSGIRFFDTAPHYGLGLSERRLGAALAGRPRGEFAVSTKVGRLLAPNTHASGSDLAAGFDVPDDLTRVFDFSRDGVLRSLDASLRRLGMDCVDVVLVHDPDEHLDRTIAETIPALVELREQGVISAVGAGMNHWQPLRQIVAESDVDTVMIAGRWTLADRSAAPLLDACAERGVGVLAAAAYNSGLLADPWPADGAYFDYAPAPAERLARARQYADVCRTHGTTLPHAAVQFPLRHPAVAAVVVGMRSPAEVETNTCRLAEAVPDAAWAELE
jgi:D-threo-aldose 1-dehydrogenase